MSAGRIYYAPIEAVSVSAAQDLWEILAHSAVAVRLRGVYIAQSSDTDSEQLGITISRVTGAPTSGSGGGSITPTPARPGDTAAASTVERNNTTQISGGTSAKLVNDSFNVLSGYTFAPPEIEMPVAAPSTRLVVAITAPADAITINGYAVFEEIGG